MGKGAMLLGACVEAPKSRIKSSFTYPSSSVNGDYLESGILYYRDMSAVLLLQDAQQGGSSSSSSSSSSSRSKSSGGGFGGPTRKSQRRLEEEVQVIEEEEGEHKMAKLFDDPFTDKVREAWKMPCAILKGPLTDQSYIYVTFCCEL